MQTNNKRKGKGYRTKIILLCVRVFIGFMGVSHGFTLYIIVWSGVIKNATWSMVGSWGFQRTRDWKKCTTQKLTLFWTWIFSLGRSTVSNKSSMLHHVPKVSHPIPMGLSSCFPIRNSNEVFHSNGGTPMKKKTPIWNHLNRNFDEINHPAMYPHGYGNLTNSWRRRVAWRLVDVFPRSTTLSSVGPVEPRYEVANQRGK